MGAYEISQRADGWHVVSRDGKRHLGGPYATQDVAGERLRQVEAHQAAYDRVVDCYQVGDLPVAIETRAGEYRQWGPLPTQRTLHRCDYGFFEGTRAADGDGLDVFVGPDRSSPLVVVVRQLAAPGFDDEDELKVLAGYAAEDEAIAAYLAHRDDPRALGAVRAMALDEFRSWLETLPRSPELAALAAEVTNFPKAGDNQTVGLRRSAFKVFDPEYVEDLSDNWPELWDLGGNVKGNNQYRALFDVVRRADGLPRTDGERDAIIERERWAPRHADNNRPPGVVALMKWFVVGSIGTKEMMAVIDAEKERVRAQRRQRLQQFAHGLHSPFFGQAQSFDVGSTGAPGPATPAQAAATVSVRRWDRFTTWGRKVKDGREDVFNETTLGQMVANFKRRGDVIAMDNDHATALAPIIDAPALAFYSALAVARNGRVVTWAAVPPDKHPVRPDDAAVRELEACGDGLWGYRCEITPRGMSVEHGVRNYRYLSPMFDEWQDEQGKPCGYVLFCVAATNNPFQANTPITFARTRTFGGAMDPKLMQRLALTENSTEAEKKAAMAKYAGECAAKMADGQPAELRQYADDLEAMAKMAEETEAQRYRRMAQRMRTMAEDHREPDGDEGQLFEVDPSKLEQDVASHLKTGSNNDEGRKHSAFMAAQIDFALRKGRVPADKRPLFATYSSKLHLMAAGMAPDGNAAQAAELAALQATLRATSSDLEKLKAAEKQRTDAAATARAKEIDDLVAEVRRIPNITDPEVESIRAYAQIDPAGARRTIARIPGSSAQLMTRYTAMGHPLVGGSSEPTPQASVPGLGQVMAPKNARLATYAQDLLGKAKTDAKLEERIKAIAGPNANEGMRLFAAQTIARADRPDLVDAE